MVHHNPLARRVASAEQRLGMGASADRHAPASVYLGWCHGNEDPSRADAITACIAEVTAEARQLCERGYDLAIFLAEDGHLEPRTNWRIRTRSAEIYQAERYSHDLMIEATYQGWLDALAGDMGIPRADLDAKMAAEGLEEQAAIREEFMSQLRAHVKAWARDNGYH